MAQRTIHYLFGELLSRRVPIGDKARFLLGSLLPDAYLDRNDRDTTHFIRRLDPPERVCFDFHAFRARYGSLVREDELYLGYYMHLAEDCFYRRFIHHRGLRLPVDAAEVALLHQNYHALNRYIVDRYGIHNILTGPIELGDEAICRLAPFRLPEFLTELDRDFHEDSPGPTPFITAALLDEFMEEYLPLAQGELEAAMAGRENLRPQDFATVRRV